MEREQTKEPSAVSPNLPSPSSVAWIPQVIKADEIPAEFAPFMSWWRESPTAIQSAASTPTNDMAELYMICIVDSSQIKIVNFIVCLETNLSASEANVTSIN